MSENDGTFSKLMEIAETAPVANPAAKPSAKEPAPQAPAASEPAVEPAEDLSTTPYMSQNYRFTADELKWLKQQAFELSEHFGTKISQNLILRIALHDLRQACDKNPSLTPLSRALSRLKK